jgi:hypothetical protein
VFCSLGAYLLVSGSVSVVVSITQRSSGQSSLRGKSVETKPNRPIDWQFTTADARQDSRLAEETAALDIVQTVSSPVRPRPASSTSTRGAISSSDCPRRVFPLCTWATSPTCCKRTGRCGRTPRRATSGRSARSSTGWRVPPRSSASPSKSTPKRGPAKSVPSAVRGRTRLGIKTRLSARVASRGRRTSRRRRRSFGGTKQMSHGRWHGPCASSGTTTDGQG